MQSLPVPGKVSLQWIPSAGTLLPFGVGALHITCCHLHKFMSHPRSSLPPPQLCGLWGSPEWYGHFALSFLEKMIFGSQGEEGSRILSHETNKAKFTHAVTSPAQVQRHNHSQSLPHFKEFEKKCRQKFISEGNHRLWNQGHSSFLVLLNHSIEGFIFIHQEMVKTSTFNNASSASNTPRAPTESSRILVLGIQLLIQGRVPVWLPAWSVSIFLP